MFLLKKVTRQDCLRRPKKHSLDTTAHMTNDIVAWFRDLSRSTFFLNGFKSYQVGVYTNDLSRAHGFFGLQNRLQVMNTFLSAN